MQLPMTARSSELILSNPIELKGSPVGPYLQGMPQGGGRSHSRLRDGRARSDADRESVEGIDALEPVLVRHVVADEDGVRPR